MFYRVWLGGLPRQHYVCMSWDDVIEQWSPMAMRPGSWPEPDGWFWGWNREEKLVLKELVRVDG